jgi:hypothetical protein
MFVMFFRSHLPKTKCGFWSPCDNPTTSCNQNWIHSICLCTFSHSWELKCECMLTNLLQFCSIFALLAPCVLLDPLIAFVLRAWIAYIWWVPKLCVIHNCHVMAMMLNHFQMLIHALHLHLWQWNSLHIFKNSSWCGCVCCKWVAMMAMNAEMKMEHIVLQWWKGLHCNWWSGKTHEVDNLSALCIGS